MMNAVLQIFVRESKDWEVVPLQLNFSISRPLRKMNSFSIEPAVISP